MAALCLWHLSSLTKDDPYQFWGCMAYGIPAVLVFSASTAYHFFADGFDLHPRLEIVLKRLDHGCIYFFMAGCYTPVILNVIGKEKRGLFLALIWTSAFLGIGYALTRSRLPKWAQHRVFSTGLYISMGWLVVFHFNEFIRNMNRDQITALLLGCLAYLIGAAIYASKKPKFFEGVFGFHEMWHATVMVGFLCHYSMILGFYS